MCLWIGSLVQWVDLPLAMVPFGSTGMTAVSQILMPIIKGKAGTGYDDRIQSSPSISALTSSTVGVGRAILDVVSEDKEVTGQDVKDVMTLISLTTGVPVTLSVAQSVT